MSEAQTQHQQTLLASLYAQFGAIGPNNVRDAMQEMFSMYGQTALANELSDKPEALVMARMMANSGEYEKLSICICSRLQLQNMRKNGYTAIT